MAARRALQLVFKVGYRSKNGHLLPRCARHEDFEEFEEECIATCNGPYDGKWSKTMVGFGPEDGHFVAFQPLTEVGKALYLAEAPGGYHFYLVDKEQPPNDLVRKVCLAGSDLQESIYCCSSLLGMKLKESNEEKKTGIQGCNNTQCKLELHNIVGTVDHGTAFGRLAFSCKHEQLADLEALMTKGNHKILGYLDTPGKACLHTPGKAWLACTPLGRLG
uniref:Glyoxalase domain-containing protein 4 n=1 Tax=Hucho hucho TaxID=62062 RepID=A0A4W5QZT6_9TELE